YLAPCKIATRLGRVALDVAPYARSISIHDFHSLRQFLQVLESRRPNGIAAECFADGLGEFRGLRGFHAAERDTLLAVLEPDSDPVRRMRVDHHAVVLPDAPDGREAVGVGARSRHEPGVRDTPENLRARQGKDPVGIELCPQGLQPERVTANEIVGIALEAGGFGYIHGRAAGR